MVLFSNKHIVELTEYRVPAQSAFMNVRHIFLTKFLIRKFVYADSHMSLSAVMRRHIRPLITVMPDQIIAAFIRDHRLLSLENPLFDREHHIFVKKKRAATPAHGIAVALFLIVGKHYLLEFLQRSFFAKKNIRKKILQIHGCRYLPAVTVAYRNIDKIRVNHHVRSIFLVFFIVCRNRIQCKNVYDLSATVLADDLAFMNRTGIGRCIAWK